MRLGTSQAALELLSMSETRLFVLNTLPALLNITGIASKYNFLNNLYSQSSALVFIFTNNVLAFVSSCIYVFVQFTICGIVQMCVCAIVLLCNCAFVQFCIFTFMQLCVCAFVRSCIYAFCAIVHFWNWIILETKTLLEGWMITIAIAQLCNCNGNCSYSLKEFLLPKFDLRMFKRPHTRSMFRIGRKRWFWLKGNQKTSLRKRFKSDY